MKLTNKKLFFYKKKSYVKNIKNIFINFIDLFLCGNNFFLTKLDKMPRLNKFETQRLN